MAEKSRFDAVSIALSCIKPVLTLAGIGGAIWFGLRVLEEVQEPNLAPYARAAGMWRYLVDNASHRAPQEWGIVTLTNGDRIAGEWKVARGGWAGTVVAGPSTVGFLWVPNSAVIRLDYHPEDVVRGQGYRFQQEGTKSPASVAAVQSVQPVPAAEAKAEEERVRAALDDMPPARSHSTQPVS